VRHLSKLSLLLIIQYYWLQNNRSELIKLDLASIAASHGSACASGGIEPSRVLLKMEVPPQLVRKSTRFSLSRLTTKEEIEDTIAVIAALL
jgi:cysteine desulfurase